MLKLLFGILLILSVAGCLEDGSTGGSSRNKATEGYDVGQNSVASIKPDWSSTTLDSTAVFVTASASASGITNNNSPVPEPSTIIFLSIGLGAMLAARRKKIMT